MSNRAMGLALGALMVGIFYLQAQSCKGVAAIAEMARAKLIDALIDARQQAGESYLARLEFAYRSFQLHPPSKGPAQRLLGVIPRDDAPGKEVERTDATNAIYGFGAVGEVTLVHWGSSRLNAYTFFGGQRKADPDGYCDWCQRLINGLNGQGWKTDAQLAPPPPAPPPPKPPALVQYNPPKVGSAHIDSALSAVSLFFASNTVRVSSGDRNYVPKGGARDSAHLTREAADFRVIGIADNRAYQSLKDPISPVGTGFRLIEHGPNTVTQGAHLHLDARNKVGHPTVYMHEGRDPQTRSVYAVDKTRTTTTTRYSPRAFLSPLEMTAFAGEPAQEANPDHGSEYYPLAEGNTWTYRVQTGSKMKSSTVEWRVTSTEMFEEGPDYEVWPTPRDDDDDAMLLHESPDGIEETDDGVLILTSSVTTGERWTSGTAPPRTFHVLSVGQPCGAGPVTSHDCVTVEEQDEAIHLRIITTYAKGIGPIRYEYFLQNVPGASPVETVELLSYHPSR
ncbi:MAG: hypothetical protein ACLQOO_07895 [Terriglobia bacterium]